jgi:Tol biopolymer transport system component
MPSDYGRRRVAQATFSHRWLYLVVAVLSSWSIRPASAQPANDLFANRFVRTGTSWSERGTITTASMEVGEPVHQNTGLSRSAWWTWTAPESGVVSLDTFPSSHATAVGVYQGTSVSTLVLVTNAASFIAPNGASRVSFEAVAGATYEIVVAGNSFSLSFGLNFDLAPPATNDAFARRTLLAGATNRVRVHNAACTIEPGEPVPPGGGPFRSSWWSWTAPTNGLATVDVQARGFVTRATVYTGEGISNLTRVASASIAERTSGSCTFMATQGVNYILGVDAPGLGSGVVDFTLRQPTGAPEIVGALADILVGRADQVEWVAAIGGTLPIDFQWYFGDQPIPRGTNVTLRIEAALESHVGAYHLRASNALGSVVTPPVTLAIATNWIEFTSGTLTVLEGNRGTFSVRRSGFTNALNVPLAFTGSAVAGVDFVPLPPVLAFARGQTNITVTFETIDDPDEEPTRLLEIGLVPSPHYSAASPASMVVQQQDDDPNIRLSVDPGFARRFDPQPGRVLFRRTGNLDRTLTVPFGVTGSARPGSDFEAPPSPVVFLPGQSVVPLPILAVPGVEAVDRSLVVTAEPDLSSNYLLRVASAQVDIIANRAPRLRLTSPEMWSSVAAGATIRLAAMAEDPEGSLTRVEFLEGSRVVASDDTPPFETAAAFAPGIHLIRARAIDNRGASAETEPVSVVVGAPVAAGRPLSALPVAGLPGSASTTANGGSWAPEVSADSSRIAFTSMASDLGEGMLPGISLGTYSQVWLHELSTGVNHLASATAAGLPGNGDSTTVAGGLRGDWLVFQSEADNLATVDANQSLDLFARNIRTGQLVLLSARASSLDIAGNGPSENPVLNGDGTRLVFESRASDLVAGDANGVTDIFVRDLPGTTNRLVSINATGAGPGNAASHSAVLSHDGRRVAFLSSSTNLILNLPVLRNHLFVRDLETSVTRCVSASLPTLLLDQGFRPTQIPRGRCHNPSLSADGRHLAFKISVDNGIEPALLLRYDWETESLEILSRDAAQPLAQVNDATTSAISLDGQVLAYETTNHVRVWNGHNRSDIAVSVRADGSLPATGWSRSPVLSPDGRTVTFLSNAPELTSESVAGRTYLYSRSVDGGPLMLISRSAAGVPVEAIGGIGLIPGTRRMVFASERADIVNGDLNSASDVFLRDVDDGSLRLISARRSGAPGSVPSVDLGYQRPSLSADRSRMAVVTSASLSANDTNRIWDVYLWDRAAGTWTLASVNTNGVAASRSSRSPVISGDGRIVAFVSDARDLAPMDTNRFDDVFVYDPSEGRTVLVSSNRFGATGPNNLSTASAPMLSHDGEWVAFVSAGRDMLPEPEVGRSVYMRHWRTGFLVRVPGTLRNRPTIELLPLHISDTAVVTFLHISVSSAATLWVADPLDNRAFLHGTVLSRPAVTPDGRFTAYVLNTPGQPVHVFSRDAWTNLTLGVVLPTDNATTNLNRTDVDISNDGRRVAFLSSRSLDPRDTNATNDVYVFEMPTGPIRLVSGDRLGAGVGDAPASALQISPDGRFIAFRSRASNLMPGTVSGDHLYLRDLESNLLWRVAGIHRGPGQGAYPGTAFWGSEDVSLLFRSLTVDVPAHLQQVNPPLLTFAVPPNMKSDFDSDGMDDAWEWKWFGNQARTGTEDWDLDGLSDRDEFIAGTDPTQAEARLTLVLVEPDPDGVTVLQWPAAEGRSYDVLGVDELGNPNWQVLSSNIQPTGGTGSFRVNTREGSHRFFRVLMKP